MDRSFKTYLYTSNILSDTIMKYMIDKINEFGSIRVDNIEDSDVILLYSNGMSDKLLNEYRDKGYKVTYLSEYHLYKPIVKAIPMDFE